MTTGERIRQRRKEIGMNADDLAEAIGVSRSTIFRYENGFIEKVPIDSLLPIAEALHTTPAYLMGWEEEKDSFQQAAERRSRSVQDMFKAYCGAEAYSTIEKFLRLDETDRKVANGYIDGLLANEKYSIQDESRNA